PGRALKPVLTQPSREVIPADQRAAAQLAALPPGTEVFVANLPRENPDRLIDAAAAVRTAGFEPVPHVVARNLDGPAALEDLLHRLVTEADVNRVLLLGGDRPASNPAYTDALQLITSGAVENAGLRKVFIGCY